MGNGIQRIYPPVRVCDSKYGHVFMQSLDKYNLKSKKNPRTVKWALNMRKYPPPPAPKHTHTQKEKTKAYSLKKQTKSNPFLRYFVSFNIKKISTTPIIFFRIEMEIFI